MPSFRSIEYRILRFIAALAILAGSAAGLARGDMPRLAALSPGAIVLFQGDSITDGGRWPGADRNHIMGQSYAYLIAAQVGAAYPERHLTFLNRGIGGNTVADLDARWQADVIDLKPDVLSILVGVNDVVSGEKPVAATDYRRLYARLIDRTRIALPHVKIVLGQPFLLPVGAYAADFPPHRTAIAERQRIVADLARRYDLPLVRYQVAFDRPRAGTTPADWVWDGIHPTYAGHGLMAREWIATVDRAWR